MLESDRLQAGLRALWLLPRLFPGRDTVDGLWTALVAIAGEGHALQVLPPELSSWCGHRPLSRHASRPDTIELDIHYQQLLTRSLLWDSSNQAWTCKGDQTRRRRGAHYTPPALARQVVERALSPLLEGGASMERLRICDPACGAGAFLVAAVDVLRERYLLQNGVDVHGFVEGLVKHRIHGVDLDALALVICRMALADEDLGPVPGLVVGDALALPPWLEADEVGLARAPAPIAPGFGQFDVVVGNPPWVAYVGRATQPLEPRLARFYAQHYSSFRRYRTLHGLFVECSARLSRPGGRLGLLLPTSVADLDGYAPTRLAHDALCQTDEALSDFGDGAFDGVFQPCMALTSTRRRVQATPAAAPWELEQTHAPKTALQLLRRLAGLPRCPSEMFGERGYQTTREDRARLLPFDVQHKNRRLVPLLTGTEVLQYERRAPRWMVDPQQLASPLRPSSQWETVAVLIRQTARFPIAALSDGTAFRNSVLAGFELPDFDRFLLVAYLNSTAVRWLHFTSRRDARQGMPQLKIGHLRGLPCPPRRQTNQGAHLSLLGRTLSERNTGASPEEQAHIDEAVFDIWQLSSAERAFVRSWGTQNPPPKARR